MANSGGVYTWSRTATTNASADSTVNYAEGQAPSSLNDSARNAMASVAKWRDDISGAIVTTGTSTGYLLSSYQQFDSLAHMDGQVVAFSPHTTNTGNQAFINVDSLGSKTIRSATGVDVPAGTLVQGTPYEAVYNNSDGVFYLKGFYGNPYNIPLGATLDYWLSTAPNSSFVFPYGQAISRTTYAALFALMGTYWGTGDGSTTFNLPDLRGRFVASPDVLGASGNAGRLAGNATLTSTTAIGGIGGEQAHTLSVAELPTGITSSGSGSVSTTGTTNSSVAAGESSVGLAAGGNAINVISAFNVVGVTSTGSASVTTTSNNTSGSSHNNLPPTILCNRIMRII